MNDILDKFCGEEKLYKKVLKFSDEIKIGLNEEIILDSYINIYNDLKEMFKVDFDSKEISNEIKNMNIFRDAYKYRLGSVAVSIYNIIKIIYPLKSDNLIFSARFKSYESIFMKRLFSDNVNKAEDIHDYFGIRFTVPDNNPELCYNIFEIINKLYVPYGSRYKDFIPMPNERGYQTLQWTSIVPDFDKIEFQIRTVKMADINDNVHDEYKDLYISLTNLNNNYLKLILK